MGPRIRAVYTRDAPEPVGPYSQAMVANDFVFVSGQIGIDPVKGMLESGVRAQTERCLMNLEIILKSAGTTIRRAIRCTIYITDIRKFKEVNEVYSRFFDEDPPTRVTVEVAALPLGALIEIEAIAVLD